LRDKTRSSTPSPFISTDEQFRLLMDSVSDYSIFFTDVDGNVVSWNTGAERILGWTETEIIGQNARIVFTPEDLAKGDDKYERETAATEGRAEDERWHLRKDGSRFWASGILTALKDEAGGLRGYCKILRDLTERKRWEDELQAALDRQSHVAETLQNSFLMVPPPDAFPGLSIKPLYESASDDALIGGDFFDIFALAEDKVALVVGDATGHGIEAATFTAEAKFALRAFLRESPRPAVALQRLNVFLADKDRLDPRHMGNCCYIALALCVVDTRSQELCCAWAGIEPPFVLRAETGKVVELLECDGPLLGMDHAGEFREQCAALAIGDVLAMSTDGLTEARRRGSNGRVEFFGLDGVERAVREEVARHPHSLGDTGVGVAQQARDFAGGTINDDICLLLVRCTTTPDKAES
jgi:PAS domain S-box-containing protein